MSTTKIDAKVFKNMLNGGAAMLSLHKDELNELNVFPVADGDTGTTMSRTLEGAIAKIGSDDIKTLSKDLSSSILLSARGNSGVILSQIFAGICEILGHCETVGVNELVEAYRNGVVKSYASVQNPTEGTILTVFRESTEYAAERMSAESTVEDFFRLHTEEAMRSLARTKDILPALAEAGVIDSGAAGYTYVAEGMREALEGKEIRYTPEKHTEKGGLDISGFTRDSILEYGYCTELLIRLTTSKVDPEALEISTVISSLEDLSGESIVAYKQDDIVKVHVHTFRPGEIMNAMQSYGEFLSVKIENMSLGHTDAIKQKSAGDKPFSVIAVAEGDGISALFKEMGADVIVAGGQTKNPSTQELLSAFKKCSTKDIIVLPNNKNVILAANQAANLYTGAAIHVIKTKNIAEGYAALSVINPAFKDISALTESAQRAASDVTSAEITQAVRNVYLEGRKVAKGDYIAIGGGEIIAVEKVAEDALLATLDTIDTSLAEIITLFVGKCVSDKERAAITERLVEIYPDLEITVYNGGQDVYDYIVAVE